MNPNNLYRFAMTCDKETPFIPDDFKSVMVSAKSAVKFMLPRFGVIFDSGLKALPEEIRLPYPKIILEYDFDIHEEDFKMMANNLTYMPPMHDGMVRQKMLIIAIQENDHILIRRAGYIKGVVQDQDIWQFTKCVARIPLTRHIEGSDPDTGLCIDYDENEISEVFGKEAMVDDEEACVAIFKAVMMPPVVAVLSLVEALSCRNVKTEALPVRKINKAAGKRGALPFDEYRVLTVDTSKKWVTEGSGMAGSGIDRNSPREHLRRGHIRVYRSGLKIWVQSTVVNVGIGSTLTKDYLIK